MRGNITAVIKPLICSGWFFCCPPTLDSLGSAFYRTIPCCLTAVMHKRTICVHAIHRGRRIKVPAHFPSGSRIKLNNPKVPWLPTTTLFYYFQIS